MDETSFKPIMASLWRVVGLLQTVDLVELEDAAVRHGTYADRLLVAAARRLLIAVPPKPPP